MRGFNFNTFKDKAFTKITELNNKAQEQFNNSNNKIKEQIENSNNRIKEQIENSNNRIKEQIQNSNNVIKEQIENSNNVIKEHFEHSNSVIKEHFEHSNSVIKEQIETAKSIGVNTIGHIENKMNGFKNNLIKKLNFVETYERESNDYTDYGFFNAPISKEEMLEFEKEQEIEFIRLKQISLDIEKEESNKLSNSIESNSTESNSTESNSTELNNIDSDKIQELIKATELLKIEELKKEEKLKKDKEQREFELQEFIKKEQEQKEKQLILEKLDILTKSVSNRSMDIQHKKFLINQANNVYSCPLLPILECTKYEPDSDDMVTKSGAKAIISKGYWDRKIGKVYRLKFLCQICGKAPDNFKGYRIHIINEWAKKALHTLNLSLSVLEFALKISGMPNGVSSLGELALNSFDTIQSDLLKSKIDGVTPESLQKKREEIEHLVMQKEEEARGGIQYDESTYSTDHSYIPINIDYINGIRDMLSAFKEQLPPTTCKLVKVTRPEDFECAWVCAGSSCGTSSSCYKKFMESKQLNTLIRFSFE